MVAKVFLTQQRTSLLQVPEVIMDASPRRRVALYSHDTQGLGHIRRNIELAAAITAAHPGTDVLLLSGSAAAAGLPLPPSTELVVLPGVTKARSGTYAARHLGLELGDVLGLRGTMIAAALRAFAPDLFVVDKVARGLGGELDEALRVARQLRGPSGRRTRVVLGLRDVLDSADVARREWDAERTTETLDAFYDEVWVYGDPTAYDLAEEYDLPRRVRSMMRYTGYLAAGRGRHVTPMPAGPATPPVPGAPYVLCLVGGGQDGHHTAAEFVRAALPPGHHGVLVTGPHMAPALRDELHETARNRSDLTVHTFVEDATALIAGAAAVVSMGGYNTVCELLASGRPGLVVPRTVPRREQAVRMERLVGRCSLDAATTEHADAAFLGAWLADAVRRGPATADLDLDGLARVPHLVDDLLTLTDPHLEVLDASA